MLLFRSSSNSVENKRHEDLRKKYQCAEKMAQQKKVTDLVRNAWSTTTKEAWSAMAFSTANDGRNDRIFFKAEVLISTGASQDWSSF